MKKIGSIFAVISLCAALTHVQAQISFANTLVARVASDTVACTQPFSIAFDDGGPVNVLMDVYDIDLHATVREVYVSNTTDRFGAVVFNDAPFHRYEINTYVTVAAGSSYEETKYVLGGSDGRPMITSSNVQTLDDVSVFPLGYYPGVNKDPNLRLRGFICASDNWETQGINAERQLEINEPLSIYTESYELTLSNDSLIRGQMSKCVLWLESADGTSKTDPAAIFFIPKASWATGVKDPGEQPLFNVFASGGTLNIAAASTCTQTYTVTAYTMLGQQKLDLVLESDMTLIDVGTWPEGAYVVVIKDKNGNVCNATKFVKH